FFSSRRRHTRFSRDWSSDVSSSDLGYDLPYVLETMQQVLPGLHPMPLDGSEPIFDSFFEIDIATINAHAYSGGVRWYGIFEDNRSEERRVGKGGQALWAAEQ